MSLEEAGDELKQARLYVKLCVWQSCFIAVPSGLRERKAIPATPEEMLRVSRGKKQACDSSGRLSGGWSVKCPPRGGRWLFPEKLL